MSIESNVPKLRHSRGVLCIATNTSYHSARAETSGSSETPPNATRAFGVDSNQLFIEFTLI